MATTEFQKRMCTSFSEGYPEFTIPCYVPFANDITPIFLFLNWHNHLLPPHPQVVVSGGFLTPALFWSFEFIKRITRVKENGLSIFCVHQSFNNFSKESGNQFCKTIIVESSLQLCYGITRRWKSFASFITVHYFKRKYRYYFQREEKVNTN